MEAEAAKYIGAGLATFGMLGAALGVGNIFSSFLTGALRNPGAAQQQFGNLIFGFAGLLLLDLQFARWGLAPGWWMPLRLLLSAVVIACLAIGILA